MKDFFKTDRFRQWFAIFSAGAAIILFYFFIKNFPGLIVALERFSGIVRPFILGLVMAYLLCPVYNLVVRESYPFLKRHTRTGRQALTVARVLATIASLLVMIGVIVAFSYLIIPQVVKSIVALVEVVPRRVDMLTTQLREFLEVEGHQEIAAKLEEFLNNGTETIIAWAETKVLPGVGNLMSVVSTRVISTIRTVLDLLIGILICVYFLNGKEKFRAKIKQIIAAHCSRATANEIYNFGNYANHTFGGMINGKIIDSLIIGIICFIAMSVMKLPYAVLVSTIIGVTNIIPFFGPFIGAIPSAILIFVMNPIQALYFLIMVFVLQQLDGNVIGPRILGGQVGLSSFWVMFAIIVGGGLFGIIGMLIGVPVFAIISYYFDRYIKKRLDDRGCTTDPYNYIDFNKYDIDKNEVRSKKTGGF